jgi:hypothetical protein
MSAVVVGKNVPDGVLGIIISELARGTVPVDQFVPTFHAVEVVPSQVIICEVVANFTTQ